MLTLFANAQLAAYREDAVHARHGLSVRTPVFSVTPCSRPTDGSFGVGATGRRVGALGATWGGAEYWKLRFGTLRYRVGLVLAPVSGRVLEIFCIFLSDFTEITLCNFISPLHPRGF